MLDDVIQPETPPLGPTSNLQGASVHALQDDNICGPDHLADHFTMVFDQAAFGLATLALASTTTIDVSRFNKTQCSNAGVCLFASCCCSWTEKCRSANLNAKKLGNDLKGIVDDFVNSALLSLAPSVYFILCFAPEFVFIQAPF